MPHNNPAAPERSRLVGEMHSLSASGERGRYAALNHVWQCLSFVLAETGDFLEEVIDQRPSKVHIFYKT